MEAGVFENQCTPEAKRNLEKSVQGRVTAVAAAFLNSNANKLDE